ncbi:hypothetical protein [Pedobacter sp. FW305-3-2-15-E-R2A2]|uniref:hypothetical protein n=1 Tax=Pedobacter sp. FW305-3-2-15-E-R2A2 TaxID=3140251 RepID=UPI0031401190
MEEAFNIKIGYGSREVTLTILRQADYYKVIYFGGIIGGVRFAADGEWQPIDPEEMEAGDLPQYTPDQKGERIEIELNEQTVETIGSEIELHHLEAEE